MKILIFVLVYLSISSVAYAYWPPDGAKVLTIRKIAEKPPRSAKPRANPKALPESRQLTPESPKLSPDNPKLSLESPKLSPDNPKLSLESPKLSPDNIREDDLETGMQRYRERKYAEAISALSRYASLIPKSQQRTAALLIIGKSLEEMDRPRSALNIYSRVIERNPDSPEALLGMVAMADIGVVLPGMNYRSGKKGAEYFRDPVAAYDVALSKNVPPPIIEHIHHQRGRALWKSKRYEEARRGWMVLLKKYPKTAFRQEAIGAIRDCTAVLIDRYNQSGDHLAAADLFLQSWKGGFIRAEDVDTLLKASFSLSRLDLHEESLNILETLKKSVPGKSPAYIEKIDKIVSDIEKKGVTGSSDQRPADAKWSQFQSGRQYLNANQPTLAEKTLTDLKTKGGDPFWSKIAEYALEENRWVQEYQGQIKQ